MQVYRYRHKYKYRCKCGCGYSCGCVCGGGGGHRSRHRQGYGNEYGDTQIETCKLEEKGRAGLALATWLKEKSQQRRVA